MSIAKLILRKIVSPGLLFFKADSILLSKSRKTGCIINFHGVRKGNTGMFNNRHIPVKEFEKLIRYLKKTYEIVPLSELFSAHRSNKDLRRKTVALTFDDGYLNNFETALPVLKKYQVPATFYIITKGLSNPEYVVWPDVIDLLKANSTIPVHVNSYTFAPTDFFNHDLKLSLLDYLKTQGDKTENLVNELIKTHELQNVLKNQVNEMIQLVTKDVLEKYKDESLIEYGSHTHTHFNLEFLNDSVAENELVMSKKSIEAITGKPVISIAYPDGSYTKKTSEIAKNAGYINQVAVEYRFNEMNTNKDVLSRFTISNSTNFESNALRLAKQFDKYGFC